MHVKRPPQVAAGVVARTGSAVVVVLSGRGSAPVFVSRSELELVNEGLPVQPYHAAERLDLQAAEEMIDRAERGAEDAAVAGLRRVVRDLPDGAAILGVAVVVKPVFVPDTVAAVRRSHAWMHAGEGVLYREAVLAAARRCGWAAHATDQSALPDAVLELEAIRSAAGRPWRRIEKDAARAAITVLRQATGLRTLDQPLN